MTETERESDEVKRWRDSSVSEGERERESDEVKRWRESVCVSVSV